VRRFALLLTSFAALSACGAGSELAESLEGREFWSVQVVEDGSDRELVPGTRIQIRFQEGNVGASAGCNSLGGQASFDGDTLVVGDMSMTEMGCDPARHAQDEFVVKLLGSSPAVSIDGDNLTFATATITMEMVDSSVANPDLPIVETVWDVTGFIDGDVAMSIAAQSQGFVVFENDSTLTGFDGCGDFTASVELSDGSIGGPVEGDAEVQFGLMDRLSAAGCPDFEVADRMHAVLESNDATITIDGQNMTMMARSGEGITFRARAE